MREPEPHAELSTSRAVDNKPEDVSRQTMELTVQGISEADSSVLGSPSRQRKPPSRYETWVDCYYWPVMLGDQWTFWNRRGNYTSSQM